MQHEISVLIADDHPVAGELETGDGEIAEPHLRSARSLLRHRHDCYAAPL